MYRWAILANGMRFALGAKAIDVSHPDQASRPNTKITARMRFSVRLKGFSMSYERGGLLRRSFTSCQEQDHLLKEFCSDSDGGQWPTTAFSTFKEPPTDCRIGRRPNLESWIPAGDRKLLLSNGEGQECPVEALERCKEPPVL